MKENLVIVESPAKAKTIEKFLGDDYKVMSSYGHIRDLKKRSFSIDPDTLMPQYEIPSDKKKIVDELKKQSKEAKRVWLASDEDREGEAISWHLREVLKLDPATTKRIVFHEITETAIKQAILHPRDIDQNLVDAQQARRLLDRMVGFKLSPVLWRKVKPSLSAGRVQSVAVRLIVEREREVQAFHGSDSYRVTAELLSGKGEPVKAELDKKFDTEQEAQDFLDHLSQAVLTVDDVQTRPATRTPAPPFTTSTLQQEAAHKLGFTVKQTMMVAQRLYENGRITYMRTDSTNLSNLCLTTSKKYVTETMGAEYVKNRQYHTHSKGAQEAHEAIRPTYMNTPTIDGTPQEKKLYELIWKRAIASQMADAQLLKTTVGISVSGSERRFVAAGEVVKFDGFLRVYRETDEEGNEVHHDDNQLPQLAVGEQMERREVTATQRFAQRPARYNEASLVKKLEELGIGRPSTIATTITTIQQRDYVEKGDKPGVSTPYVVLTLKGDKVKRSEKKMNVGAEKGRLLPTDVGIVVTDFLMEHFPHIMDYNFTADVEKNFDDIAEGHTEWTNMIRTFYDRFNPQVEEIMNVRSEHRVGERVLGTDPKSGRQVSVKIGRFGPVAQIGTVDDEEKPLFAQLKKEQSLETLTLEEALDLFRLPRTLGEWEGKEVTVGAGRFGPYVKYDGKYVSIPKEIDPLDITLDEARQLIESKEKQEAQRHLKKFDEDPRMEVLNGRYGPYIAFDGANYRLPKALHGRAAELTYEECKQIVDAAPAPGEKPARRGRYARKKS